MRQQKPSFINDNVDIQSNQPVNEYPLTKRKSNRYWKSLLIGIFVLILSSAVAVGIGPVNIPPSVVIQILLSHLPFVDISPTWSNTWDTILWDIRAPRILLAGLVGSALAISGATYQGLFRNHLADPYLIGVASGAGLGATIVFFLEIPQLVFGINVLPVAAFIGSILAVSTAYVITRTSDGLPLTTLLLAGVAIAAFASAITILLMIRADTNFRPIFNWLLGSFASAQWSHSLIVLAYSLPGTLIVLAYSRVLNVLQLDEEHAYQLGVNVERAKVLLIATAALITASAVSFCGLIGFVGLIAPHTVRLMWGVDHRLLVPLAALYGAIFMIFSDLVARTMVSPAELPVGVVTAFFGAPFFLYLLRKRGGNPL